MDSPEQPPLARSSSLSAEAIIGCGIAAGALGVLCALLGWAQSMRLERQEALIWISIGAALIALGVVTTVIGHLRKRR